MATAATNTAADVSEPQRESISVGTALRMLVSGQRVHGAAGELLADIAQSFEAATLNRTVAGQGTVYYSFGNDQSLGRMQLRPGELDTTRIEASLEAIRQKLQEAQTAYKKLLNDAAAELHAQGIVRRWLDEQDARSAAAAATAAAAAAAATSAARKPAKRTRR